MARTCDFASCELDSTSITNFISSILFLSSQFIFKLKEYIFLFYSLGLKIIPCVCERVLKSECLDLVKWGRYSDTSNQSATGSYVNLFPSPLSYSNEPSEGHTTHSHTNSQTEKEYKVREARKIIKGTVFRSSFPFQFKSRIEKKEQNYHWQQPAAVVALGVKILPSLLHPLIHPPFPGNRLVRERKNIEQRVA